MSNKKLFKSSTKSVKSKTKVKSADVVNASGGISYKLEDRSALAQLAMTGTFNSTFYTSDKDQLKQVLELAKKVPVSYVAKLAVYARQNGFMKDAPALLTAVVAAKDSDLLKKIFPKVIDNPKMLRNFVQIIRSGVVGKKSFGTVAKRLIQNYLESLTDEQLFKASVGNNPTIQDVLKLTHPRPSNKKRQALYAYLLGKEYNKRDYFLS